MIARDLPAVAAGAVLLTWPALANLYPLLFVDTGAFLDQALRPFMLWDKPWVYGPALVAVSMQWSLWPATRQSTQDSSQPWTSAPGHRLHCMDTATSAGP